MSHCPPLPCRTGRRAAMPLLVALAISLGYGTPTRAQAQQPERGCIAALRSVFKNLLSGSGSSPSLAKIQEASARGLTLVVRSSVPFKPGSRIWQGLNVVVDQDFLTTGNT